MGSRPSASYNGRNGTVTSEAETALRTENTQLKEKLSALKELDPVRIKQENEELRRINKDLSEQLEELRISTPARPLITDSNDYPGHNSVSASIPTKEKERSSRKQISKMVSHKMSDIDAYGQGIPLEKHPPIKIKSHRKKNKKKESSEDGLDSTRLDVSTDTMNKESNDEVINGATAGTSPEKPAVIHEAQDISEHQGHVNGEKKLSQESDLLS